MAMPRRVAAAVPGGGPPSAQPQPLLPGGFGGAGTVQLLAQAGGGPVLGPGAHASPGSPTPSPHLKLRQAVRQAPGAVSLFWSPLSQSSPVSTTPSPQRARLHVVRHAPAAVLLLALPESHSSPVSTTPSPHAALWQLVRQAPGAVSLLALPSSHSSSGSGRPFPQNGVQPMSRINAASIRRSCVTS